MDSRRGRYGYLDFLLRVVISYYVGTGGKIVTLDLCNQYSSHIYVVSTIIQISNLHSVTTRIKFMLHWTELFFLRIFIFIEKL